jgi:hypothetical protein
LRTFGFEATAIESLEAALLFGANSLFDSIKQRISSNFCARLKRVNRKELWERVIGSLIGAALLSGDHFFVDEAQACADRVLQIDGKSAVPFAMVDMQRMVGWGRPWENGTTLIDAVAGLPELAALANITKKKGYLKVIEAILEKVDGKFWQINATTGLNNSGVMVRNHPGFNEYFEILARTAAITDLQWVRERLKQREGWRANGVDWSDAFYGIGGGVDEGKKRIEAHEWNGALLRLKMRGDAGVDAKAVIAALEEMKGEEGYSGFVKSTRKNVRKDNIQHSSLIADWIAQVAFALTGNMTITKKGVFNSRGHLLHLQ